LNYNNINLNTILLTLVWNITVGRVIHTYLYGDFFIHTSHGSCVAIHQYLKRSGPSKLKKGFNITALFIEFEKYYFVLWSSLNILGLEIEQTRLLEK